MKKAKTTFVLILLGFSFFIASFAMGQTYNEDYQDGRIYFKFNDNTNIDIPVNPDRSVDLENVPYLDDLRSKFDIEAMSRPFELNNDPKLLKTFLIEFSPFSDVEKIIEELSQYPDLEYAEKVPYDRIDFTPNDPLYNLVNGPSNWNWHLDLINAEQAWDINQGSADIKVAVVDNAVWTDHPDLVDKIVLQRDTYYNNNNANPPSTGSPADWSHGTHVSGLVGASTNNNVGVASIGYNVSLIAIKAANNNNPNGIYGYPGIEWAANNGANVINMSWGGSGSSSTNQNLINTIHNMGIVLLASAGNDNNSAPHYPSNYNNVISVASVDYDDTKSSFSCFSTFVDISAPGGFCTPGPSGLLSSTYEETTSFGFYNTYYGTSMSCPVSAGLAGLILSVNPDLTPDEVEDILESTAVDIDPLNPGYEGMLGAGRIDAYQAVLNTPFAPGADFSTPVTVIMPGSSIDFTDLSIGIPDEWDWSFEGGSPASSTAKNPSGITYNTEGVYDVTLEVTNAFGTSELVLEDYITVTSTPAPYVNFGASDSSVCLLDAISFTDLSLYDPTSWTWEFSPATVTFIDGTSQNSQNPVVQFDAPGYYTVTLNATNANGSSSLSKTDFVFIQGINPPFDEDFESGTTTAFTLAANEKARVTIDSRAAADFSQYGLHFQGTTSFGGWSGGPTNTTPEQAWVDNEEFHGTATNCKVDASGVQGIALTFDLRQTFGLGQMNSWFRVLADDVQMTDMEGMENFNPTTNTDPFVTRMFDLSQFGNSYFSLTLQSACYLSDKFYEEGDNVFVDNIAIYNFTGTGETQNDLSVLMYPVPASDVINLSLNGSGEPYTVQIFSTQGQKVYESEQGGFADKSVQSFDISNLTNGVYILKVVSGNSETVKKLIIQ